MKAGTYFIMIIVLSMAFCGIAIAEDQLVAKKIDGKENAKIEQSLVTPEKAQEPINEMQLASGCGIDFRTICEALKACCCKASPDCFCDVCSLYFGPNGACTNCVGACQ